MLCFLFFFLIQTRVKIDFDFAQTRLFLEYCLVTEKTVEGKERTSLNPTELNISFKPLIHLSVSAVFQHPNRAN